MHQNVRYVIQDAMK